MGNSGSVTTSTATTSSTENKAPSLPVPDFFYKGKPYPHELPLWFKSISLVSEELPHLKTIKTRTGQEEMRFSHELSENKKNGELARKITLDCSKRCTFSYKGDLDEFGMLVEKSADTPAS